MGPQSPDVRTLRRHVASRNRHATVQLIPLVYDELHRVAEPHLRLECPNHTLQPTALVHEAYLKLVAQRDAGWQIKTDLCAVASQAMPRMLVDLHVCVRSAVGILRLGKSSSLRRTL